MISLSNVIKSSHYVPLDSTKLIEAASIKMQMRKDHTAAAHGSHQAADLEQAVRDKQLEAEIEQIKAHAHAEADAIIQQAVERSEQMKQEREQELADWRAAREQEFIVEMEQAIQDARERAYAAGWEKGEQDAQAKFAEYVERASVLLQEAHMQKREIIADAEPFLLELSVQIAEMIVGRQLSLEPEWTIALVKRVLTRERRRGVITLCVSPEQYPSIREAREELASALDSQAELHIVPDMSVRDDGCVVRSDFGSLDARIDSQLQEIKQALIQLYTSEQEEVEE